MLNRVEKLEFSIPFFVPEIAINKEKSHLKSIQLEHDIAIKPKNAKL